MMLQAFFDRVNLKNPLHAKFLDKSLQDLAADEAGRLERLVSFYMSRGNCTMEEIADKYLYMISFIMEDQFYFAEHDSYRFSTFAEVENYYKDPAYMDSYTVGLGLSTYLWRVHREVMRFFSSEYLRRTAGGKTYFEIGPGHGEYMVTAMQQTDFRRYLAIDISETSVALTRQYIRHCMKEPEAKNHAVMHGDFFAFQPDRRFDVIVMGEVLEHVEHPARFLNRIREIASNEACIFISTATNAPHPDHIYLFRSVAEVVKLFDDTGFEVADFIAANANNVPLEKAERRKIPVVMAFILRMKK
jgi:2-polyprenyl-3-methyl-5-hydroxy-6-metoxy-1,4-benzoquinol methylase